MSMRKRKKVQILSREELRLRRWNFGLVPSERSLEAVGKSVRLHIIGRSNVFDLFPRTYKGKKRCVLRQKTRFDKFPRTNANLATHLTSIWSNRATWNPWPCCTARSPLRPDLPCASPRRGEGDLSRRGDPRLGGRES